MATRDENYLFVPMIFSLSDRDVLCRGGWLDARDVDDPRAVEQAVRGRILNVPLPDLDKQRQRLAYFLETSGRWPEDRGAFGPRPGHAGCLLDHRLLIEFAEKAKNTAKSGSVAEQVAGAILLNAAKSFPLSAQLQRSQLHCYVRTGAWFTVWGPPPGRAGCRIDPAIIEEFKADLAKVHLDDDDKPKRRSA